MVESWSLIFLGAFSVFQVCLLVTVWVVLGDQIRVRAQLADEQLLLQLVLYLVGKMAGVEHPGTADTCHTLSAGDAVSTQQAVPVVCTEPLLSRPGGEGQQPQSGGEGGGGAVCVPALHWAGLVGTREIHLKISSFRFCWRRLNLVNQVFISSCYKKQWVPVSQRI